jgi:hypothetical protein
VRGHTHDCGPPDNVCMATCACHVSRVPRVPPTQAEGHVYGWYYPALKPHTHYVPFMVKHKDDILGASLELFACLCSLFWLCSRRGVQAHRTTC